MSALADSPLIELAVGMTRGWTALYTWRLPDDLRESRRAEIESDLWEHRHLAMLGDEAVYATALGIILRFLLGLPADLAWRMETRSSSYAAASAAAGGAEPGLLRWAIRGAYPLVGYAAFSGIYGVTVATITGEFLYLMFAVFSLMMVGATGWGLHISARRQPLGILLVAGGSLTFTITWSAWYPVYFTLPASVGLIAISYWHGWRSGRGPETDPDARDGFAAD